MKTGHAPSRHCRDARVYGHTATAMHDDEYTPPYAWLKACVLVLFAVCMLRRLLVYASACACVVVFVCVLCYIRI